MERASGHFSGAWPGDYSMRRPEMAREMTSSWICSVPSKMSMISGSRSSSTKQYL